MGSLQQHERRVLRLRMESERGAITIVGSRLRSIGRTGTSAVSFISPPRRTTSAAGSSPMSSARALRTRVQGYINWGLYWVFGPRSITGSYGETVRESPCLAQQWPINDKPA